MKTGPKETPRQQLLKRIREAMPLHQRRGDVDLAFRSVDLVVDECIAIVKPAIENAWGGWDVLEQMRALKSGKP